MLRAKQPRAAGLADLYQGDRIERVFGPAYGSPVPGRAAESGNGSSDGRAPEPP